MYLTPEELSTHAYDEEIQTIIRGDETIALACIDMAIEYAESKLSRHYVTEQIFDKTGADRSPLLLKFIKDIALWELIGLANPSIDYEDKKFRYQEAVNWLTAVYKGMPANFPKLPPLDGSGTSFSMHSNPKRENYF